jgi:hypothetical protein
LEDAASVGGSLTLVHVDRLQVKVFRPGEAFGNFKRRVQAVFRLGRNMYAPWITDPIMEQVYLAKPDGDYQVSESYLTISLGEALKGKCYKLVATVMQRP